jgi:hypothetical protein
MLVLSERHLDDVPTEGPRRRIKLDFVKKKAAQAAVTHTDNTVVLCNIITRINKRKKERKKEGNTKKKEERDKKRQSDQINSINVVFIVANHRLHHNF